jgi:hypothetical protein
LSSSDSSGIEAESGAALGSLVIRNRNFILVQKPAHNLKGLELTTMNSNQQFGREEFAAGSFIPTRTQELRFLCKSG